jgi:CRISPR-associated protein Csd1
VSWIQKLCETYDYAVTTEAVTDPVNPLPEVGFVRENVAVEVTLSADGKFIDADLVPKERQQTVIPCTLESGMARQNPVSPHPIFDKAKLLATPKQLTVLKAWCERLDVPLSVKTVYAYLEKQTLMDDLNRRLAEKKCPWDSNCYVRFSVNDGALDKSGLWLRKDVKTSWKQCFYEDWLLKNSLQLCYVTGEILPAANKHPNISGNTLLISMVGDNCIGHFEGKPQEALSVSCETTIKAHNAWKWLAARQGKYVFGMTFVAWDTYGFMLPDIMEDEPDDDEDGEEGPKTADTNTALGNSVASGISGYWSRKLAEYEQAQPEELSTVVMMAIDSATGKGRASIVYYQELNGRDYLENLMYWYKSCKWVLGRKEKDGVYDHKLRTPLPKEICSLVYGEGGKEGQKKLKKQLTKQLLPCITMRRPVPQGLVDTVFHKVSNPLSFKDKNSRWNKRAWQKAVEITCALSTKYDFDKGDEHAMALDEKEQNRSYVYGRLLAIADIIEQVAQKQGESSRTTNAMRYMQRFRQRPGDTWITLRLKLEPYINKLTARQQSWYRRLLSEVESRFIPGEMQLSQPLNVRFLEGYSCQITDHYKSNKSKKLNAEDTNKEE